MAQIPPERATSPNPSGLLVIGLGNPGAQYAGSRHNCGAEVAALLADRHGSRLKVEFKNERAVSARLNLDGRLVVAAVPQTYYNEAGLAAAALMRRCSISDPSDVVIVHDELDLPPGRIKLKSGGGLAGNNGLKSIQAHLHTDAFTRVRIGVGKPPGRQSGADYVLGRAGKAERVELDVAIEFAADAVEMIASVGLEAAMVRFNRVEPGD